jgi:hypothetical protein
MIEDKILYGQELIPVNLPKEVFIAQPEGGAEKSEPIHDIKAGLKEAINNPLGLPPLSELTKPGMKVTIAFDDPTVGQANTDVWKYGINLALEEVFKAGVKKKNIDLVCANALHRKFTHLELSQIIGEELVRDFGQQLYCHDAEDKDNLVNLGRTESGFQVDLNRCVTEADLVVYVNTYLARAFNGGWKSICVGLSSCRSIRQHHHPDIMSMSVDRNPMHDILNEMGDLVDKKLGRDRIFKIETLQKNYFQVAKFWAGSIPDTRQAALVEMKKHYTPRRNLVKEKTDIVLYGVPEGSPYAAFSQTNPFLSLISNGLGYFGGIIEGMGKPGCTVILSTPAKEEWDLPTFGPYKEFFEEILPKNRDPYRILDRYSDEFANHPEYIHNYRFRFSHHPILPVFASFPLKRLKHAGRVFVAGAENKEMIKRLGFETFDSVESAIMAAQEVHGSGASIGFTRYPVTTNRPFV